jgi:hypothetical protein
MVGDKQMRTSAMSILLVFICLQAFCSASAEDPETLGPQMVMEEAYFDFGEVKEGDVVSHTFRVFNRGDQPLQIEKVKRG